MKKAGLAAAILLNSLLSTAQAKKQTLSVLAIGNGHYVQSKFTMPDINFSASAFLNCFKKYSTPCLLQSSDKRILTKTTMLNAIQSFVDFVGKRDGELNVGIIYYCGHGIASLQGNLYFIPGDLNIDTDDTTVTALSKELLNIDEIKKMIIKAQMDSSNVYQSRFFILGDCCSNQVSSKWYKGISYRFFDNGELTVQYDSSFWHHGMNLNSSLKASAELTFDTAQKKDISKADSTSAPFLNEIPDVGESIRANTFLKHYNQVYYSSKMGESAELAPCPKFVRNSNNFKVGPMCRRTLLYFYDRNIISLTSFFKRLTEKEFDRKTLPVELNPSRNPNEYSGKE